MRTSLIQQIEKYLVDGNSKAWPKNSFWPSETEANVFDIYHKWKGTPVTNGPSAQSLMMMKVGKLMEESYTNMLFKMGVGKSDQARVDMEREGVKITGYIDQILVEDRKDVPLEIKSFYGPYAEKELKEGKPKKGYLQQLAIYMDYLGVDLGYLLHLDRGSGKPYQFSVVRTGPLTFKCLDTEIDLGVVYKKWSRLFKANIEKSIEPKSEFVYKYDVTKIDWSKVSNSDISKARVNKKVLGDFQAGYSPFLDLLIEREGTTRGYTTEEIAIIKAATKGYSTKKK
jgi:hypothetical protein